MNSNNNRSEGFVVCSVHRVRRKVNYCVERPIYDADKRVVGTQYVCSPDHTCTVKDEPAPECPAAPLCLDGRLNANASATSGGGARHQTAAHSSRDNAAGEQSASFTVFAVSFNSNKAEADAEASTDTVANTSSPAPAGAAVNKPQQQQQQQQPRTAARYYDPSRGHGGGNAVRKVCWHCGLPGHEKPDCPNVLCRTCHGKRPPYGQPHFCGSAPNSNSVFVAVSRQLPSAADGMPAVRCLACGEMGHFDCSPAAASAEAEPASPSCCFCSVTGHSGFSCDQKESLNPDRWVQRQLNTSSNAHYYNNNNNNNNNHHANTGGTADRRRDFLDDHYRHRPSGTGSSNSVRNEYRHAYDNGGRRSTPNTPANHQGSSSSYHRGASSHSNNNNNNNSNNNYYNRGSPHSPPRHNNYNNTNSSSSNNNSFPRHPPASSSRSDGHRAARRDDDHHHGRAPQRPRYEEQQHRPSASSSSHHRDSYHRHPQQQQHREYNSNNNSNRGGEGKRRGGRRGCSGWSDEDNLY